MCMDLAAMHAAGVTACRIIDSPVKRLIAVITNNFVPATGGSSALIALSAIFIAEAAAAKPQGLSISGSRNVCAGIVILGDYHAVYIKSIVQNHPEGASFFLCTGTPLQETPATGRILIRWSLLDRTCPAGPCRHCSSTGRDGDMANGQHNLRAAPAADHSAGFLDPVARLIGLTDTY